jgi:asparagine synthase (glutamine-hydrolysing)
LGVILYEQGELVASEEHFSAALLENPRLEPAQKIRGTTHKHILKRVAQRYLPDDIVHRGKQGFVMPLSEWLAGRLHGELDEHLGAGGLARRGLFRDGALPSLLAEHRRGRRNHAGRLWALLILERWFRRWAPSWTLAA